MCGIIGFSGVDKFDADKIKILMLANMTRGVHSTGMYNDGKVIKEAGNAIELLAKNELVPDKIFIGHDRYATIGHKTAENAHPFEHGKTILVHNGTLTNHWAMARAEGFSINDFNVDSNIMAALIDKQEKSYKVLSEFEGAAALIWTNRDDPDRIYCFRNDERPLFRGYVDGNMYLSSIENSLKLIGCEKISSFKTNYVYSIKGGKIDLNDSKQIIRHKKKKKSKKNSYNGYSGYNNYKSSDYGYNKGSNLPAKTDPKTVDRIRSYWMKCKQSSADGDLIKGEWYQRVYQTEAGMFATLRVNGMNKVCSKMLFEDEDDILKGDFVVAMKSSDNGLIEEGEIMFVDGIEEKTDSIGYLFHLETNYDNNVYTWSAKYFRKATEEEALSLYVEDDGDKDKNIKFQTEDEDVNDLSQDSMINFDKMRSLVKNTKFFAELENIYSPISLPYENVLKTVISADEIEGIVKDISEYHVVDASPGLNAEVINLAAEISSVKNSLMEVIGFFDEEIKSYGEVVENLKREKRK